MPVNHQARVKITSKAQASGAARDVVAVVPAINDPAIRQTGPIHVRGSHVPLPHLATETKELGGLVSVCDGRSPGITYAFTKRAFDLLLGSVLLLAAVPIVLFAAIAIRMDTPGSPFFFQTRIGKGGKPFTIFKLRGMFIDARTQFPEYYDYSKKRDLEFCFHHEDDPRVTRAGRFIRKTSIDELPNLWNVVKGDVSLVGPRPEIPEVLALYGDYRDEYLSVKPGVTCLSKVTGRDRLTKRETIEFDLAYIRNHCFSMDLKIIWRTFRGVVLRRDVY